MFAEYSITMPDITDISHPLLGPEDPAPVGAPRTDTQSPFVLVCDHAGNAIPNRMTQLGLPVQEIERHIGIDIGALAVAQCMSDLLDAPLIHQRYSRLVIDCNRETGDSTSIPIISDGTRVPGNDNLSDREVHQRITAIFNPYHDAIGQLLDRRAAANQPTVLVAVHSFTPQLRTADTSRPWHTDIMFDRDPRIGKALLALLRDEPDIFAGENEPYGINTDNDYTIPVHGERRNIPYVGIEIRQDLLATTQQQQTWANRMAQLLPRTLSNVTAV